MDFALTDQQQLIRDEALKLCARFDDGYWLERDRTATFPEAFFAAMAEANWLGIAMPEQYGGAGLGITEAAILMQAVAESGACMSGASAIHLNIFGLNPVVVFGTVAQKRRMLPPVIAGSDKACFGVTEPNAGLNTTQITTRAERRGDRYVINGAKIWTSTAQIASKILLLARTTPLDRVKRHSHGLTLFYTTLDRAHAEVRLIHKMGRHAIDSNMVFFTDMEVPEEDRIGEEGEGFRTLLHGLNPERVLVAAEAIGIGRAALARASRYARERVVFGRPIGQNQGIQHPLAKCWAELEASNLMVMKAAWLYDQGQPCGAEATGLGRVAIRKASKYAQERVVFGRPIGMNQGIQHPLAKAWMQVEAASLMVFKAATLFDKGEDCGVEANSAKYLAAEAGYEACQTAVMSMGGMGYAQEYHVERYLREVLIPRIAPVSPHQIMNFIAERVLELPKSY